MLPLTTATSLLLYRAVAVMKLPEKMLPMLLLPSCNYVEVDCEYAMYVADTHTNTLSLPTTSRYCCYRAVMTSKLTADMPCMLPIHIITHCCCLPIYRYCYIAIAKPRPCPLSNLMHGGNTFVKGLGLALVSALVSGKTLGSACSSRIRCPDFPPHGRHGGLSDEDFTITVVPIRRPRTEATYDPWKLPIFDLNATGPR